MEAKPHRLLAVMVNVRVGAHGVPPSTCVTFVTNPQPVVVLTWALTLLSVGRLTGLQPRYPPDGRLTNAGTALVTVTV